MKRDTAVTEIGRKAGELIELTLHMCHHFFVLFRKTTTFSHEQQSSSMNDIHGHSERATGTAKARRAERNKVDWAFADWDVQDVVIARNLGCSRERVRQKRKELGVGRSPKWHQRVEGETMKDVIEGMETEKMTLKEVAKAAGCRKSYALQCLLKSGKGYTRTDRRLPLKYYWSKADWTMTDNEVAKALGVKNAGVVSQYRFRHNIWKRGPKANLALLFPMARRESDPSLIQALNMNEPKESNQEAVMDSKFTLTANVAEVFGGIFQKAGMMST